MPTLLKKRQEASMDRTSINILIDLAQLDIDAVCAYNQALEKIDTKRIFDKISKFKDDHIKHIEDLSALIIKLGGTPPTQSKDLKGYFIEGMTALRSITGTTGALHAMETNERITNRKYKEAIENIQDASKAVLTLLKKNYKDEQNHLKYIQAELQKMEDE